MPTYTIACFNDVAICCVMLKKYALALGFSLTNASLLVTAVSELATNIVKYAKYGKITFESSTENKQLGIKVIAWDNGPGIADIDLALQVYSTGGSLGLGLPAVKRIADKFEISSSLLGTTIEIIKWKN